MLLPPCANAWAMCHEGGGKKGFAFNNVHAQCVCEGIHIPQQCICPEIASPFLSPLFRKPRGKLQLLPLLQAQTPRGHALRTSFAVRLNLCPERRLLRSLLGS